MARTRHDRAQFKIHVPVPDDWRLAPCPQMGASKTAYRILCQGCIQGYVNEWSSDKTGWATHTFVGGVSKTCHVRLSTTCWQNIVSHTSLCPRDHQIYIKRHIKGDTDSSHQRQRLSPQHTALTDRRPRARSCAGTAPPRAGTGGAARGWSAGPSARTAPRARRWCAAAPRGSCGPRWRT